MRSNKLEVLTVIDVIVFCSKIEWCMYQFLTRQLSRSIFNKSLRQCSNPLACVNGA